MTRKVKPLMHLEQLEPRILLSGDSLLIGPNPQQDTILDNTPQVVQYTELLNTSELATEQISQEMVPSNTPNSEVCQPVFTLFVDDDSTNDESADADLSIDNIGSAQVNGEIAILLNDSDGDIESKVGTTEDGGMPTYINDTDLSIEYATSIEIRGPPASETVAFSDMHLVDRAVDYFDGQVVYLDFDGEENVTYNGPVTIEGIDVPAFVAPGNLAGQEDAIIAGVVEELNQVFTGSGVAITVEKPEPHTPYSTIYIGGDDSAFAEYGSFLGLAEQVDVGNQDRSDSALVFVDEILSENTDQSTLVKSIASVIAHEVGHLVGYEHDHSHAEGEGVLSEVATEYVVNSLLDTVELDGHTTLREAIEASNTNSQVGDAEAGSSEDLDIIRFEASLAGGTIVLSSELTLSDDVIIEWLEAEALSIDADNNSRILSVYDVEVVITGLLLTGSYLPWGDGGGIYNSGTLTLTNTTVMDNSGYNHGGGIYNSGTLTLTNTTVSGNSATSGGGIYNSGTLTLTNTTVSGNLGSYGGGIYNNGTLTLTNTTVMGNSGYYHGGGIYNSGTLTMTDTTVSGNSVSNHGGGIYNDDSGTLILTNTTVTGNSASIHGHGGGIYNSGTLTLTNATVSGNSMSNRGGGIYNDGSGTLTLTNTMVSSNSASNAGGILNIGTLILTNAMVSGNSASNQSGGISNGGMLTLTNTTISGNSSGSWGGGIQNSGTLTLHNTVVTLNESIGTGPDIYGRLELSSSHNFIGDASGVSGISDGENGNIVGGGDPGLFMQASDGSIVYYPISGSALIDAGDSSLVNESTDMFGNPRVQGGSVDIGAIEGVYDLPTSLTLVSPAEGAILQASRSEPIKIDVAVPPSATFSVFLDDDGVIDGDEKLIYQDVPIWKVGALHWKSAWSSAGTYVLTVIINDESFITPMTDQNQFTIAHPDQVVYVVDSLTDTVEADGQLTLREALEAANTNISIGDAVTGSSEDVDIIRFEASLAGGTIVLSSELTLSDDVIIEWLEAEALSIDADNNSRVLRVYDVEVVITGLLLTGGNSWSDGGGIYNFGTLTLTNTTVSGNSGFQGGGIYNDGSGTLTLTNTTISGNSSGFHGGGIYNSGTLTLTNCTVTGNSSGSYGGGIYNSGTLTLTNTTVSGNSGWQGGGIYNDGSGTLTLTNTTVSGNSAGYMSGGIYNSGTLTLTNCTVTGNSSDSSGGGIYNQNSGTLTLTNTTISGNSGFYGGGIYNSGTLTLMNTTITDNSATTDWFCDGGGIYNIGTSILTDTTVSGNSARDYGGGIYNSNGTLTLTNCTVTGNSAYHGGGIYNYNADGTLTLTDTTVSGNSAGYMSGGIHNNGTLTLTNCTVMGNSSIYRGGISNSGTLTLMNTTISGNSAGGIYNDDGILTLTNCTVTGNSAYHGGGIYNAGTSTLTNCTVTGNSATGPYGGGGIYNAYGTLTLTNCTVTGNWATGFNGGGISLISSFILPFSFTINNSVVALNESEGSPDISGVLESSSSHNFIGDALGLTGISDGVNGNIIGGDPLFVRSPSPGPDNEWGTDDDDWGDLQLQSSSPCINTGNNALALDAEGNPLTNDLRGYPRIVGGIVDIGAYEFGTMVVCDTRPRYIDGMKQFQIQFSENIDPASIENNAILLVDQAGQEVITNVTVVDDRFALVEIQEVLSPGIYTLVISPSVQSTSSNNLDQDLDGTGGEPEDECSIEVHVGVWAPRVLSVSDSDMAGTVDSIDVYFSRPIDPASFSSRDVTITDPGGNSVAVTSIDQVTGSRFKVNFLAQTDYGIYTIKVMPWIEGIDGTELDQNQDGFAGSLDDIFLGTFQIVEVDLQFSNVAVNTDVLVAGELVMVTWSGHNASGAALYGSWTDGVYLSANDQLDTSDQLLGTVRHDGGLEQDAEYMGSATVAVPGVLPGDYYVLVRGDMRNEEIEGDGEQNNVGVSAQLMPLEFTVLTVDIPLGDVFEYSDQSKYYIVTVPADEALQVVLDDLDDLGHNELYIKYGAPPTRSDYDARYAANLASDQVLAIDTRTGVYYILVYAEWSPDVPSAFTVSAEILDFVVLDVSPTSGGNTGNVTLTIQGAGFANNTTVRLIDSSGTPIEPIHTAYYGSTTLSATFDLRGRPTGLCDIIVSEPSGSFQQIEDIFQIVEGGEVDLICRIETPAAVRPGRPFTIWVEYANMGMVDELAPLLIVTSPEGAPMSLERGSTETVNTIQLLGINPNGMPSILPPGVSNRIPLYCTVFGTATWHFELERAIESDMPIDWDAVEAEVKPDTADPEYWEATWAELTSQIGGTWGDYIRMLRSDADLLPEELGRPYVVSDVFQIAIQRAEASVWRSATGYVVDRDTGQPVGSTLIHLTHEDGSIYATGWILNDGSFVIPGIHTGTYGLLVDGYLLANESLQLVVPDTGLYDIGIEVVQGGFISGVVRSTYTLAPLGDAQVFAHGIDGDLYAGLVQADGAYLIGPLPTGIYSVSASSETYAPTEAEGVQVITGQEITGLDFHLELGGSISGSVSLATGGPAATTYVVEASSLEGSTKTREFPIGEDFAIGGLVAGSYRINVYADGYAMKVVEPIDVALGEDVQLAALMLDIGGGIEGTIIDADTGEPIVGAAVFAQSGDETIGSGSTGDDGAYQIPNLASGPYAVEVIAEGYWPDIDSVAVLEGETTVFSTSLNAAGGIHGTVTDSSGSPIVGMVVQAMSESDQLYVTTTEADGRYEFAELSPDQYTVSLGGVSVSYFAQISVTLDELNPTHMVNFSLDIVGSISGTIYDQDGVTPLEGTLVALGIDGDIVSLAESMTDGSYKFIILNEGTYTAEAYMATVDYAYQAGIVVTPGSNISNIDFIAGSLSILGSVVDAATGQPIPDSTVSVVDPSADALFAHAGMIEVETDGSFEMRGLIAGEFRAIARAPGYALQVIEVTLVDGAPAPTLEFQLGPGATISGLITDSATGEPIVDALVLVIAETGEGPVAIAVTDEAGEYTVTDLDADTYIVRVLDNDHQAAETTVVLTSGGTVDQDFALAESSSGLSGHVFDETAPPLRDVDVVVVDDQGQLWGFATTESDGSFVVNGLPPGTYMVSTKVLGYAPASVGPVVLLPGETAKGLNLSLTRVAVDPPAAGGIESLDSPAHLLGAGLSALEGEALGGTGLSDFLDRFRDDSVPACDTCANEWQEMRNAYQKSEKAGAEFWKADLAVARTGGIVIRDIGISIGTSLVVGALATAAGKAATEAGVVIVGVTSIKVGVTLVGSITVEYVKQLILTRNVSTAVDSTADSAKDEFAKGLGEIAAAKFHTMVYKSQELASRFMKALGKLTEKIGWAISVLQALATHWRELVGNVKAELEAKKVWDAAGQALRRAKAAYDACKQKCKEDNQESDTPNPKDKEKVDESDTRTVTPVDPNDKIGPSGSGEEGFVAIGDTFSYAILFENDPDAGATAAAQQVYINDQLDPDLDWATFELGDINLYGDYWIDVPEGRNYYETLIDLRPQGNDLLVCVTAGLDSDTGEISWLFESFDPMTMELPEDPWAGFLPVNNKSLHNGEGRVLYSVKPLADLDSGTEITNQAFNTFDINDPVPTPVTRHTIDAGKPTSQVDPLPAEVAEYFTVSWTGQDDTGGSGIGSYDIYVSEDSGDWQIWLDDTTETSAVFPGVVGHNYGFYSLARDNVGHVEDAPAEPDTATTVVAAELYGVCYGPFRAGQSPELGIFPTEEQVEQDIGIIVGMAGATRTYGIDNVLGKIPEICDQYGIGCYAGGWISGDPAWDQQTVSDLIALASQGYDTTRALIVGNESLLFNHVTEQELIDLIGQVDTATEVPVTTGEPWGVWLQHPDLANAVDFISIHVHPYWEDIHIDDAAQYVIDKYNAVQQAYPDKEVVILETGWPSAGEVRGQAVPSGANQEQFVVDFVRLAETQNIKYFIFEAFDEPWKQKYSEVEGHWGLYFEDRTLKPHLESILVPMQVESVEVRPCGFVVHFRGRTDPTVLNLYDTGAGVYGPADMTVVGDAAGPVAGSMVYDEGAGTLIFVKTGGPLLPDAYTMTLFSRPDGFRDLSGRLLDGDYDGVPGGDFRWAVMFDSGPDRVLSVPDFTRGPGQAVNVPATDSGILITVSDGTDVEAVSFAFEYDPTLLTVTEISLAAGLPGDWSITYDLGTPGHVPVTVSGPSPLDSGEVELVEIQANIPNDAPYSSAAIIGLSNIQINEGAIPSRADSSVQVVAYFGDATGNHTYSGLDAAYIARVAVVLDSGFAAYQMKDPVIVADVTGNGQLSGLDAAYVARKAVGLEQPEIPDLPDPLPGIVTNGPDPLLSIPANISAYRSSTVTVPILVDDATGLFLADIDLQYDTSVFDLSNSGVNLGALTTGWSLISNVDDADGRVRLSTYSTTALGGGFGSIVELEFNIRADAVLGVTDIDLLESCSLNEGALVLTLQDGKVGIQDDITIPTLHGWKLNEDTGSDSTDQLTNDITSQLSPPLIRNRIRRRFQRNAE